MQISTFFDKKIRYIIVGDDMNVFEMLILNMVLISYPFLIYIIYILANKNISKQEKDAFLDFILVTSCFLITRYGIYFEGNLLSFFLGSIVFLSYFKNRFVISFLLQIVVLISCYPNITAIFYFIIVYAIIDGITFLYQKNENFKIPFIDTYLFFYSTSFLFWFLLFDFKNIFYSLLLIFVYIIMVKILTRIIVQGEKIMKTHLEFKELQKEQQIRLSLFKITHEIKNPVAVCKAYLDMFDVEKVEHSRKYVPIIKNEIERLLLLLQDFLLVNQANMKYEIMDVNMLLEDVSNNIQPLMIENSILFEVHTMDDELFINGDYNRLSQVIINVLKNSIEAKANNIVLRTYLTNKELEVYVEDNGQGIEKENANKIFEPFYTTKPRGSGLGVSLSKEIITAHHGKLEYFSQYGYGTRVKITLPLYSL